MRLSSLNGKTGFSLTGIDSGDLSGLSVNTAGDVDKDGYDDVIIGAYLAESDFDLESEDNIGISYIFYGKKTGYKSSVKLEDIDGSNGFAWGGDEENEYTAVSVASAGDIDGDGYGDLLIGASLSDRQYIVWGKSDHSVYTSYASLLGLGNGVYVETGASHVWDGMTVNTAGDMNGDGYDDVLFGGAWHDGDNDGTGINFDSGKTWVLFGGSKSKIEGTISTNDFKGSDGFLMSGLNSGDLSGGSLSTAGDINGDGYDDIIIGARQGDAGGGNSGESYVIFGKSGGFSAEMDLNKLNGSNGFRLDGASSGDQSGRSVSTAGDINGDGYDDLLVGAPYADPDGRSNAGTTYVIFGKKSGYTASKDLDSLTDKEGFAIEGIDRDDWAGFSADRAGDVNGDGYDDIIIGAPGAASKKGESYVLFGGDFTGDSTVTGSSSDDLIASSSTSSNSVFETGRDNPLTPGETVNAPSESRDPCIGETTPRASFQGDRSDLFSQFAFINSMEDDDQQDG
jgi:hypothetical protein